VQKKKSFEGVKKRGFERGPGITLGPQTRIRRGVFSTPRRLVLTQGRLDPESELRSLGLQDRGLQGFGLL